MWIYPATGWSFRALVIFLSMDFQEMNYGELVYIWPVISSIPA